MVFYKRVFCSTCAGYKSLITAGFGRVWRATTHATTDAQKKARLSYWAPLLVIVGLVAMWAGPTTAVIAASDSSASTDATSAVSQLLQSFQSLSGQGHRPAGARSDQEDAFAYQQDQRLLQFLKRYLRVLDGETASQSIDDTALARLDQLLDAFVEQRLLQLEARIEQRSASASTLSGIEQITAEAYAEGLIQLRMQYLMTLVDVVEARNAVGQSAATLVSLLRERLQHSTEAMLGTIGYSESARTMLVRQLADSPDNTELKAALDMQVLRIERAGEQLAQLVDMLERLGVDTTAERRVLLRQSNAMSVSLVDADVLSGLFDDVTTTAIAWWQQEAFDLIFNLLIFTLILLAARVLARLTRRAMARILASRGNRIGVLLQDVLTRMAGGVVMALGFLVALSQLGISVAPMLAGLGVAGFIIGFALQDVLGNFAAGAMILAYRPFDTDDYIDVAGVQGTVKRMNLVSTTINTPDNQSLIIPNSKIWGDVIRNYTGQRMRRVDLEFGVSYGDSIEHVEAILGDIIANTPEVLPDPPPNIRVHRLGESSVDFIVRPWVATEHYWDVYWRLQREVKLRFDEEGICIPFPQRDVHHYYEGDPAKLEVNNLNVD